MAPRSLENEALRKTRWLTQALILSGMLNIGLIASFIYVVLQEKQESLSLERKPLKQLPLSSEQISNSALLRAYSLLPFQELILRLENKELAEEGLYKRDLALSILSAFHHFNLNKALYGFPLQKRSIPFANADSQEKIDLPIYLGLSDDQFQAILRYAKTEKWPLTAQGLFYELQRSEYPREVSLVDAFCLSAEYEAVKALFFKTGLPLSCEYLINLLCEGEWKWLSDFAESQRQALDLSIDRRRTFLFAYLDGRSKTSAKLLIETDLEFLLKRCDDTQILALFDLYEEKSSYLDSFAKTLLSSPRTDTVWRRAASALYAIAGEPLPDPYDHRIVLQRFFPKQSDAPPIGCAQETPAAPKSPSSKPLKKIYTVENGDNLWKISRKFHVSIEEIMKINHLDTEKLRPGKQLEIPVKEKV